MTYPSKKKKKKGLKISDGCDLSLWFLFFGANTTHSWSEGVFVFLFFYKLVQPKDQ